MYKVTLLCVFTETNYCKISINIENSKDIETYKQPIIEGMINGAIGKF
jgi:hypothetical protein